MRVVLDTNVVVSGLLSPFGPPADILRLVVTGRVQVCYDARTMAEYEQVLQRPRFPFSRQQIRTLLLQMVADGHLVHAVPLPGGLPDPDDEPFLAVALGGEAAHLVTGNVKHYPRAQRRGVSVVTPAQFVECWRAGSSAGGAGA